MDYDDIISQIALNCMLCLEKISRQIKDKKRAIIFDIDETIISLDGTLIQPIFAVYKFAKSVDIHPIFITNRHNHPSNIDSTMNQLISHGLPGPLMVIFRDIQEMNYYNAKLEARREVLSMGYDIVMSIGDRLWDIGEHGGIGILLPRKNNK